MNARMDGMNIWKNHRGLITMVNSRGAGRID